MMNGHHISPGHQAPFSSHVSQSFIPPAPLVSSRRSLPGTADLDAVLKGDDRTRIKQILRDSNWPADHEIRQSLWIKLCRLLHKDHGSIFSDMVREVFGEGGRHRDVSLPSFVDPTNMLHYHLTDHGVHVVKKIVCIVGHTNPDITFSPAIFALTSLVLHYTGEEDCYNCMYCLLHSQNNHVAQTKLAYEASKFVLKDLAKKYARAPYMHISKTGMVVEGVFENWLWWILNDLPFTYLVRIMDCFLYEGPKILYRVALAILVLFHKHAVKSSPKKSTMDISTAISQFCEDIPVPVEKLLKVAFGIRGLSRKEIKKITVRNEMYVKSVRHVENLPHMTKSTSCDSLNLKVSRSLSGPLDSQLSSSGVFTTDQVDGMHRALTRGRSRSQGVIPLADIHSNILTLPDWQALWQWLPMRMTVYQPELLYTSREHGTSIKTFYTRCENNEPTLIIIKTGHGEVIGAYCSTEWAERRRSDKSLSYFGTGESFIFSMSPKKKKYEWVGIKLGQDTPNSAHMFQAGDNTKLTIGGGAGEGLQLDENLYQGYTHHCDTFNNDPLCASGEFICSVMEVYGFH